MAGELIGALRVSLGLDTAQFEDGAKGARKHAKSMERSFQTWGKRIGDIGKVASVAISLPFAALIKSAIPAAKQSREALGQVEAALKSMGPAAGRTSEQLQAAAKQLESISTFDDDDILREGTANLLTFGNIAKEQFDRAQMAAVDLASRMKTGLQPAFIMIGKALNDPAKGLAALRRVGIQFTEQQQAQIKTMVEAKNVAGAQKVMLAELERQFGGSAKAMRAADPTAQTQQSWRNFQEIVGEIALKYLPLVTDALTKVLDRFNKLDPSTQKFLLGATAVAAILGPLAMVIGPLVSLMGSLFPLIASTGGAAAGATVGFAALSGLLVPLVATAGALYAIWVNWDKIGPELANFAEGFPERLKAIDTQMRDLQKDADAFDKRMGIPTKDDFFKALSEDFNATSVDASNWASVLEKALLDFDARLRETHVNVVKNLANLWQSFDSSWNSIVASTHRMVTDVSDWLGNRLTAAIGRVKKATQDAAQWFRDMYDKVVGHSYVPDMVDEIAANMLKLDAAMVTPAKTAAERTKQVFQQLQSDLSALMATLFPESVALNQYRHDVEVLATAHKNGTLNAEEYAAALARLRNITAGLPADGTVPVDVDTEQVETGVVDIQDSIGSILKELPDFSKQSQDHTAKVAMAFAQMAQNVVGSLGGLVDSIKNGGFLDILDSILDVVMNVMGALQGMGVFGKPSSGSGGYGEGDFGGFPGFATGGSFKVGGNGGTDSKLVAFRATPGEMVDIKRPGSTNDNGALVVYVKKGEMFEAHVERVARPMVEDGVQRGAVGGAAIAGRNFRRGRKGALA